MTQCMLNFFKLLSDNPKCVKLLKRYILFVCGILVGRKFIIRKTNTALYLHIKLLVRQAQFILTGCYIF